MSPSSEEVLRARLHEVDELEPPGGDFEFRALRAGRDRQKRRQAWTRGLVGAAAAVVIGALAVPALGRLPGTGGASGTAGAPAQDLKAQSSAAPPEVSAQGAPDAGKTQPFSGSGAYDWSSAEASTGFDAARTALSSPAYVDIFTGLAIDRSVSPARLVVHLTRWDDVALETVASLFPPGAPIAFARSAYSARSCSSTLLQVESDRTGLPNADGNIADASCNVDGRVAMTLAPGSTPAQVAAVQSRYGDPVVVVGG